MPDPQTFPSTTPPSRSRWLTLGVGLTVLVALMGMITSVSADSPIAGNTNAVAAQATSPVGQNPGSRLQPVGNGDTIASPVDATDDSGNRDSSWWWRVVFGAAVVAVVLVALVQRRQVPDRTRGAGGRTGTGRRGNDRNALGH